MEEIKVKVLADSENSLFNSRLTTFELTYPRCIHSEFMTHRTFSRNAASSRAIPIEKTIREVEENSFVPAVWGYNQKGMQAHDIITDPDEIKECEEIWLEGRDDAVKNAKKLLAKGLHKQIANRVLEPYTFITVVASTTQRGLNNFFHLRSHEMAEPHIKILSDKMQIEYDLSNPKELNTGEWHLPLTGFEGDEDLSLVDLIKVSVGRCARVSYKTHNGIRDVDADIKLFDRLRDGGHWSPFEHVAKTGTVYEGMKNFFLMKGGNFGIGWEQYRKVFPQEFVDKRG